MEEKLIELVRNHPVIFDTSHSQYMKTKLKHEIWIKIAKELNLKNGDEAKFTWVKLRNNHRDALRRQRRMKRSGAAAADIKPWKFQAQMDFLVRYMVNTNRDTNFTDDEDRSEEDHCAESEIQHCDDDVVNNEDSTQPNTPYTEECDIFNSSANSEPEKPSTPPISQPKKKVKKNDMDNLIKRTVEKHGQRSKERNEERKKLEERTAPKDDLYLFFMSMYEQTKKMPPASQHIVRRSVFLTVSQEEAHLLNIAEPVIPSYQQFYPVVGRGENIHDSRANNCSNWSYMSSSASTSFSGQPPSYSSGETMVSRETNLGNSNLFSSINSILE